MHNVVCAGGCHFSSRIVQKVTERGYIEIQIMFQSNVGGDNLFGGGGGTQFGQGGGFIAR